MQLQKRSKSPSHLNKISKLQQNFKQVCLSLGLPLSYCNLYIKSIANYSFENQDDQYKYKMYNFADQINQIKQGDSFPQNIRKLMHERESIIKDLRSELISSRNTKQLNLSFACQAINNIRMFGLMIVELIQNYKNKIRAKQSVYFNEIIQKITHDIDFLRLTPLRKHIELSNGCDPLFIVPLKKYWNLELISDYHRRPVIDLFTLDANYKKRLLNADRFIKSIDKKQGFYQECIEPETGSEMSQPINSKLEDIKPKIVLPIVRKRTHTEQSLNQKQKKDIVSNLIKEVIQEYEEKSKIKSRKLATQEKLMERPQARPQARSIDSNKLNRNYQPNGNISQNRKYKVNSMHTSKKQNQIYRRYAPIKLLPHLQRPNRQQLEVHSRQNQLQRQVNYTNDMPQDLYQSKTVDLNDVQVQRKRQISGKIKFNQFQSDHQSGNISKKHSIENSQVGSKILYKKQISHNSAVYQNLKFSVTERQELPHNNEEIKQKFPQRYNQQTESLPQQQKWLINHGKSTPIDYSQVMKQQYNEIQLPSNHYSNYAISKQYQYDEYQNRNSNGNYQISRANQHKNLQQKPQRMSEQFHKFRINFQFNHQIYCPPYNPIQKDNFNREIPPTIDQHSQYEQFINRYNQKYQITIPSPVLSIKKDKYIVKKIEEEQAENLPSQRKKQIELEQRYRSNIRSAIINKANQNHTNSPRKQNPSLEKPYLQITAKESQSTLREVANRSKQPSQIRELTSPILNSPKNTVPIEKQVTIQRSNSPTETKTVLIPIQKIDRPVEKKKQQQIKQDRPVEKIRQQIKLERPAEKIRQQTKLVRPAEKIRQQIKLERPAEDIRQQIELDKPAEETKQQQIKQDRPAEKIGQQIKLDKPAEEAKQQQIKQDRPAEEAKQQIIPPKSNQKVQTIIQSPILIRPSQTIQQPVSPVVNSPTPIQQQKIQDRKIYTPIHMPSSIENELKKEPTVLAQSIVLIQNPSPALVQKSPPHTQVIKQQKTNSELMQILKKCSFQSKSIQQSELLKQLQRLSPGNYEILKDYISKGFFANRHILLTNCVINNQISSYCLYCPFITSDNRNILILHLQITQQNIKPLHLVILNTFIKYIFSNDPCEKIIYLRHNGLIMEDGNHAYQSLKNYAGEVKTPFRLPFLNENSYSFARKEIKCSKDEELTSVFNFLNLFVANKVTGSLSQQRPKDIRYQQVLLKKITNKLTGTQSKKFKTKKQLESYLEEESFPLLKQLKISEDLSLANYLIEDTLIKPKFIVFSKHFYFTIDPPFSNLYEGQSAYFLILATSVKNKYFILGDKLYDQKYEIDLHKIFKQTLDNYPISKHFHSQKFRGKIVSCPMFKKQSQTIVGQTNALTSIELNWVDYLKGIRYIKQDKVYLQLICPFFCGLAETDSQDNLRLLCSGNIQETDLIK